ncbi:hypothetical protein ACFOLL_13045 [Falsochrobactrum ovis]|nr:hypothetical protein [Falsochrobactrum ovis]
MGRLLLIEFGDEGPLFGFGKSPPLGEELGYIEGHYAALAA